MMVVCSHCLMAIESHEGNQWKRKATEEDLEELGYEVIEDEDSFDTYAKCDWCEEEINIDDLWVIE